MRRAAEPDHRGAGGARLRGVNKELKASEWSEAAGLGAGRATPPAAGAPRPGERASAGSGEAGRAESRPPGPIPGAGEKPPLRARAVGEQGSQGLAV